MIVFVITAAGVVPCGGPKKSPRTSSIVRFIFYFRSVEIRKNTQSTKMYVYSHFLNNALIS